MVAEIYCSYFSSFTHLISFFRSLSYSLTGSEKNHIAMRLDILEFLETELDLYTSLSQSDHDWWSMFTYLL